jgi:EF hand
MNFDKLRQSAIVAGLALAASSISLAQSPSLMQPNNSAGTPDSVPRVEEFRPGTMPTTTESSLTAFTKLDAQQRGYVTRDDLSHLSGHVDFESADRNHDGRLDMDEFQRAWAGYGSGGQ